MTKLLWLKFERSPHADAVAHPANEAELRLVLALLELPYRDRCRLSGHLRNWLKVSERETPFQRPGVAVRFGQGLYQPVPWRLAKWLASVLPMGDGAAVSTRSRIRQWLENERDSRIIVPR